MKIEERKFGLIGYPLSHSFSPTYFKRKFERDDISDSRYDLYPIESIHKLPEIVQEGVLGLNVTIPYKEEVLEYVDELSPEAEIIGAVNTLKINNDKICGYNTDAFGFRTSLIRLLNGTIIENALILGSGGASKAVQYVLTEMGIKSMVVSRSKGDILYSELDQKLIESSRLIVNTTPLGMSPKIDELPPIPYSYIGDKHFLYDLIYNPEKTLFLERGLMQNAHVMNGYDMLCLQAEKSWEIWNKV